MKHLSLSLLSVLMLVVACGSTPASAITKSDLMPQGGEFSMQLPQGRKWQSNKRTLPNERRAQRKVVTEADAKIGPANSYGTLYGPDGFEWYYTADFVMDDSYGYKSVTLTIYNGKNEKVGTIVDNFELGENDTAVNYVEINPNITRKFFNVNDNYEVIVFIHATTTDYMGRYYQHVFTIGENQTKPLMTIDGNQILMGDFAADRFQERYQMVMMREVFEEDNYFICYDVYGYADWSSLNAPRLLHTFKVDYNKISGLGEAGLPIILKSVGGKPVYALASYDKPYFDPSVPVWEEPVVTPDNTFIMELYDGSEFDGSDKEVTPYHTMRIPMATDEGYIFTFPTIGSLMGFNDVSFGFFDDTDDPVFAIAHENYITTSDEFQISYYLYDKDGNRIRTIVENTDGHMELCPAPGHETQYVFYNLEEGGYRFIDLPSCVERAFIPFTLDDLILSESMDRIPEGNTYYYAFAVTTGLAAPDGSVIQQIAYFNPDGDFDHWENINLGKDIFMAQVAMDGEWLKPYIFDTHPARDYMVLVKKASPTYAIDNKLEERLYVCSSTGKQLLDFGPSDEMGGELSEVWLINPNLKTPALVCVYYQWDKDEYTLNFNELPMEMFAGGNGTADDPYLLATPGDLMMLHKAPAASFKIINDIDFNNTPFSGGPDEFTGTVDGNGAILSNLTMQGHGLFGNLVGTAHIHNMVLASPTVTPGNQTSGTIAGSAVYNGTDAPVISNIHIFDLNVSGDSPETFGGIIGEISTGTIVSDVSVNDACINLPNATVGGIVGHIPASEGNVNRAAFSGSIEGLLAGGIVGDATSLRASDIHVSANIKGHEAAGGIVANQGEYMQRRSTIERAVVEGVLASTNADDPSVGGLIGYLEEGDNIVVSNSIVALNTLEYNKEAATVSAHRIVGHTRADEPGAILWDDPWWNTVEDPYADPTLWPREEQTPDGGLSNNYALDTCAPVNASLANDPASTEGCTVTESQLDDKFFEGIAFAFGNEPSAPWVKGATVPSLYFEGKTYGILADAAELVINDWDARPEVTFTAVGAKADDITLECSNEQIATVSRLSVEGSKLIVAVTPVANGSASITATVGGHTAVVSVVVGVNGIDNVVADTSASTITFDGRVLRANSSIIVYSTSGQAVAKGANAVSTERLAAGVYVARTANSALKIVVR